MKEEINILGGAGEYLPDGPMAQSLSAGTYRSRLWLSSRKNREVNMPIQAALFASFFPSHSERMSVIRKVTAKST